MARDLTVMGPNHGTFGNLCSQAASKFRARKLPAKWSKTPDWGTIIYYKVTDSILIHTRNFSIQIAKKSTRHPQ